MTCEDKRLTIWGNSYDEKLQSTQSSDGSRKSNMDLTTNATVSVSSTRVSNFDVSEHDKENINFTGNPAMDVSDTTATSQKHNEEQAFESLVDMTLVVTKQDEERLKQVVDCSEPIDMSLDELPSLKSPVQSVQREEKMVLSPRKQIFNHPDENLTIIIKDKVLMKPSEICDEKVSIADMSLSSSLSLQETEQFKIKTRLRYPVDLTFYQLERISDQSLKEPSFTLLQNIEMSFDSSPFNIEGAFFNDKTENPFAKTTSQHSKIEDSEQLGKQNEVFDDKDMSLSELFFDSTNKNVPTTKNFTYDMEETLKNNQKDLFKMPQQVSKKMDENLTESDILKKSIARQTTFEEEFMDQSIKTQTMSDNKNNRKTILQDCSMEESLMAFQEFLTPTKLEILKHKTAIDFEESIENEVLDLVDNDPPEPQEILKKTLKQNSESENLMVDSPICSPDHKKLKQSESARKSIYDNDLMSLTQYMRNFGNQYDFNATNSNELVDTTQQLDLEVRKLQANSTSYSFRDIFQNTKSNVAVPNISKLLTPTRQSSAKKIIVKSCLDETEKNFSENLLHDSIKQSAQKAKSFRVEPNFNLKSIRRTLYSDKDMSIVADESNGMKIQQPMKESRDTVYLENDSMNYNTTIFESENAPSENIQKNVYRMSDMNLTKLENSIKNQNNIFSKLHEQVSTQRPRSTIYENDMNISGAIPDSKKLVPSKLSRNIKCNSQNYEEKYHALESQCKRKTVYGSSEDMNLTTIVENQLKSKRAMETESEINFSRSEIQETDSQTYDSSNFGVIKSAGSSGIMNVNQSCNSRKTTFEEKDSMNITTRSGNEDAVNDSKISSKKRKTMCETVELDLTQSMASTVMPVNNFEKYNQSSCFGNEITFNGPSEVQKSAFELVVPSPSIEASKKSESIPPKSRKNFVDTIITLIKKESPLQYEDLKKSTHVSEVLDENSSNCVSVIKPVPKQEATPENTCNFDIGRLGRKARDSMLSRNRYDNEEENNCQMEADLSDEIDTCREGSSKIPIAIKIAKFRSSNMYNDEDIKFTASLRKENEGEDKRKTFVIENSSIQLPNASSSSGSTKNNKSTNSTSSETDIIQIFDSDTSLVKADSFIDNESNPCLSSNSNIVDAEPEANYANQSKHFKDYINLTVTNLLSPANSSYLDQTRHQFPAQSAPALFSPESEVDWNREFDQICQGLDKTPSSDNDKILADFEEYLNTMQVKPNKKESMFKNVADLEEYFAMKTNEIEQKVLDEEKAERRKKQDQKQYPEIPSATFLINNWLST